MIRTAFALLVLVISTIVCGLMALTGALLNLRDGFGSIFDYAMWFWGSTVTWASGVKVVVHGREHLKGAQHIIVSNHMSQHDIPVLASVLFPGTSSSSPRTSSPAFRSLWPRGQHRPGTVYIERQNPEEQLRFVSAGRRQKIPRGRVRGGVRRRARAA